MELFRFEVPMAKQEKDRAIGAAAGLVKIDANECKGCGLCVESCPPKCLSLEQRLNSYGVHPAYYLGGRCTGCGICFFACPEPGAIRVLRLPARAA